MLFFIKRIWNNYGFELILVVSLVTIVILALYNKIRGTKGAFSNDKYDTYSEIIDSLDAKKPRPSPSFAAFRANKHHPHTKTMSKGEFECKRVLESLFRRPFTNQRPDFLRNPVTGGHFNMELDCYNKDMGLAVEYNGIQHYKFVPYFHRNKDHFLNQKYRDDMKRRMCRDNRITLIEVPYSVKLEDIEQFLIKQCKKTGYI